MVKVKYCPCAECEDLFIINGKCIYEIGCKKELVIEKETPDKLCLTKAEQKRMNNWLKNHEGRLVRKDLRKKYKEMYE